MCYAECRDVICPVKMYSYFSSTEHPSILTGRRAREGPVLLKTPPSFLNNHAAYAFYDFPTIFLGQTHRRSFRTLSKPK